MNKQAIEVLETAKNYIKQGWTQGTLARNNGGNSAVVSSYDACSFCIMGATFKALEYSQWSKDLEIFVFRSLCDTVLIHYEDEFGYFNLAPWNDKESRTKEEVIEAINKTIETLKKEV